MEFLLLASVVWNLIVWKSLGLYNGVYSLFLIVFSDFVGYYVVKRVSVNNAIESFLKWIFEHKQKWKWSYEFPLYILVFA